MTPTAVAVAALGLPLLAGVMIHKRASTILAFAVGMSGALVAVQVMRVHVFTLVVVVWWLRSAVKSRPWTLRQAYFLAVAIVPVCLTTVVGEMVNSKTLALQLAGLAGSALLISAASTEQERTMMLRGVLLTTSIAALVGLLQVAKIVPIDLWHLEISSIGRPTGIYPEPDWLGLYSAIGVLLAWKMRLPKRLQSFLLALNIATLVLSFARAAWLAFVVVLVVAVLSARRSKRGVQQRTGRAFGVFAVLVSALILVAVNQKFQDDLFARFSSLGGVRADDISAQARVRQITGLLNLGRSAPWYGHGLSAAGRVTVWGAIAPVGSVENNNNVASNWLLGLWVDAKYLALPLVTWLFYVAMRASRSLPGQLVIIVLANSMFSNATYFPILWLALGLALAEIGPTRSHVERPVVPARRAPGPVSPLAHDSLTVAAIPTRTRAPRSEARWRRGLP